MKFKIFAIATLFLAICALYLYFNPSYVLAIKARYNLTKGDFKEARYLAEESLLLDPYNRFAMKVLAQAKRKEMWRGFLREIDERKREIEQSLTERMNIEQKRRLEWLSKMSLEQLDSIGESPLEYQKERAKLQAWFSQLAYELATLAQP
ncbi:MAG: hypothetical protein ACTTH5_04610 [Wolinella sp.]